MNQKTHRDCANPDCGKEFKMYKTTDKFCGPACAHKMKGNMTVKRISKKRAERLSTEAGSEFALFLRIYKVRAHVSQLSGKPLKFGPGNKKEFVKQFLHVVPKNISPELLRLDPENILMANGDEHDHQDQYEIFTEHKAAMTRKMYGQPYSVHQGIDLRG